jgi:hypothetical protein
MSLMRGALSAISTQKLGKEPHKFAPYSDGGARTRNIVALASTATYAATYKAG